MKNIFLIAFALVFYSTHAQWIPVTPPANTLNLYSVYAISPAAVAIAGDNRVIRTIDGGTTWSTPLTITGAYFYEVHSPEPSNWYSLTSNSTWFMKLGNPGGVTASNGKPDSILSLHFMTPGCGIATGIAGKIEATCDTGATWQIRSSGTNNNLNAVWFADSDTGVACGINGTITRTANAGLTWNTLLAPTIQTLNAVHFPTPQVGYIAGNAGIILKSTDAGATWNILPTGIPNALNGIFFNNADTGYVVGTSGKIMRTTDGGSNWSTMITGTVQTLNSVHFATPDDGWAVGNFATILKFAGISTGLSAAVDNEDVDVYPNPATTELRIQSSKFKARSAEVYDALGQLQISEFNPQTNTIDVSNFSNGIYFVHLRDEKHSVTRKVIVQH